MDKIEGAYCLGGIRQADRPVHYDLGVNQGGEGSRNFFMGTFEPSTRR